MNENLANRMRRRRFKSKFKNYSFAFIILLLIGGIIFANRSSYAGESYRIKLVEVDSEIENVENESNENDEDEIEKDVLNITKTMYLSEMTLDGFQMKTKYLKITNDNGVAVDNSELQYIFQYCSLWEVETLDLSSVRLLSSEFSPRILLPCKTIKKVILPDDITKIGEFVFYEWCNLEEINMPKELIEIGKACFSGCTNLNPVTFGDKITKIDEQAFLGCERFEYITLPNTINYLGKYSFADCKNLKELILPDNDSLELDGLLLINNNTILSVYEGSDAYYKILPTKEHEQTYSCKNKILIRATTNSESLKKNPKVNQLIKTINIGENISLDEFIDIDLSQSGALSYKVSLTDDQWLIYELPEGNNKIKFNIKYYLSDLDVSEVKSEVIKIDNVDELVNLNFDPNTDIRYFVLANAVEVEDEITVKVENHSSKISKNVKELSEKYSKTLNMQKHTAYMSGYKDGSFGPKDEMTNAEVAAMIARLNKFDETKKYSCNYYDVNESSWMSNYIGYVTEENIMTGSYGYFKPNEKITRGEFVVAISKMLGLKPIYRSSKFADVWGKWGEEYIVAFEELNIVQGLSDGSFGYSKTITRAEAAHIINAATGRTISLGKCYDELKEKVNFSDVAEFNWFFKDVLEATVDHYEYELH